MRLILPVLLLFTSVMSAPAATISLAQNPVAAAGLDPNDGIRQFSALGALSLPEFDVAEDVFSIDLAVFGLTAPLRFANAFAADLPAAGVNAVVVRDSDPDGDPATPFNAAVAADLIAAALTEDRAGFFVYFNSVLNLNRLVFSPNLNVNTSDLGILAAIATPTGDAAIAALPTFTAANFDPVAPVPLPAALPIFAAALAGLGLARRRRA